MVESTDRRQIGIPICNKGVNIFKASLGISETRPSNQAKHRVNQQVMVGGSTSRAHAEKGSQNVTRNVLLAKLDA